MGFFTNFFRKEPSELERYLQNGAVILDVRSPQEFSTGHIAGSRNIPLHQLREHLAEIRQFQKPIVTVCQSGMRSSAAKSLLVTEGIKAINGGSWLSLQKRVS